MSDLNAILPRILGDKRLLIGGVGLLLVVGLFGLSNRLAAPEWVVAASGIALETSGEMTDRLTDAGIAHRLEKGGTELLVAEADLARARVALARDGLLGGNRPGLELFDQQTWGWNDFTQRVNYRRALEGELERTIGNMGGIADASVHLAIGERSAFRRAESQAVTASVVLTMRGNGVPSEDVVRGIAQLVSSSVDGLSPDHVSVHDVSGRLWSEPQDGTALSLTSRQLRMQQDVERYLEQKAEQLVGDIVGAGNTRVRVAAALNFDRIERTTQSVDPERQALTAEQKAEIIPGTDGGAASTNITNSYENTRSTELFTGTVGGIQRLTVAVLVNDAPLRAGDATAAATPRTAAELAQIESLVRGAVGLDTARGDAITVISASFERPTQAAPIEEPPASVATVIERYQQPALSAAGIVAALVLGILTLNALRGASTGAPAPALANRAPAAAALGAANGAALAPAPIVVPAPRPAPKIHFAEADTQVRDRVVQTVEKDPDAAARLVKSWIKEG